MGLYLNSKTPYADYRETVQDSYFVDKSLLIQELIPSLGKKNRYFCITRPRRFGKSIMANMVGAFLGNAVDSSDLFHNLAIAGDRDSMKHLNQHNLIYIDFSRMPENCNTYHAYINRISEGLKADLIREYPALQLDPSKAVWDNLQMIFEETGTRFVFVLDEWDAVFHETFIRNTDKEMYLKFMRNLLKDQIYVELAYMTGVLPIAKYSSGSELNMFLEYDMVTKKKFSEYFGFLDSEVDVLFDTYTHISQAKSSYAITSNINASNASSPNTHSSNAGISDTCASTVIQRSDLRLWYDGYCTASGKRLYNPRSIVCALTDNELSNYWTSSGPYDELFYYIHHNIEDIRDDLALMIAGERIPIILQGYAATDTELKTKNQIYSAMVVYGLLTYAHGAVFIPNKELMDRYTELLLTNESLGYIHRLAIESERMLTATLASDTKTMTEILQYVHNTESPILSYNNEAELSAVVNLIYLAARDHYRVEREDKAGKGFVDFIFYPEHWNSDSIILELKIDSTPKEAIRQIIDKDYALRLRGRFGEKPQYTGRILAVGISYDRQTKEHSCAVETLQS